MSKHDAGCPIIQLKDLKDDGLIKIGELDRVAEGNYKDVHTVKTGDLLFRSRGNSFVTGILPVLPETCILAAPLMKLQVETTDVLPEYLCWYINQSAGQAYFDTVAAGSAIKMVSKAVLLELPVAIPPFEQQKTIIELVELQKYEADLFCKISKKREQLIKTRITQILQEA